MNLSCSQLGSHRVTENRGDKYKSLWGCPLRKTHFSENSSAVVFHCAGWNKLQRRLGREESSLRPSDEPEIFQEIFFFKGYNPSYCNKKKNISWLFSWQKDWQSLYKAGGREVELNKKIKLDSGPLSSEAEGCGECDVNKTCCCGCQGLQAE